MTNAPDRIWVADCNSDWSSDSGVWGASWENDWDVEYVRADIANDLLEALECLLADEGPDCIRSKYWDKARAAITKATEEQ